MVGVDVRTVDVRIGDTLPVGSNPLRERCHHAFWCLEIHGAALLVCVLLVWQEVLQTGEVAPLVAKVRLEAVLALSLQVTVLLDDVAAGNEQNFAAYGGFDAFTHDCLTRVVDFFSESSLFQRRLKLVPVKDLR